MPLVTENKERTGLIYMAVNKINGKKYIGQTIQSFGRRKTRHLYSYKKNPEEIPIFYRALKKYGEENFSWIVLFENIPIEELDELEKKHISLEKSISPFGYNIESGGSFTKNMSKSTKRKISKANQGKKRSEKYKKMMSERFSGDGNPSKRDDVKKKISKAMKGKKLSEEAKVKFCYSQAGVPKSEETKKKISEAHINKLSGPQMNKEWLYEKYIVEEYSTTDLAKMANCSRQAISSSMKRFGIQPRPKGEIGKKGRAKISQSNHENPRLKIHENKLAGGISK